MSSTASGTSTNGTAAKRESTAAASKRRVTAAPLDSLQTLFGPPPKRRSTGRRRSRSGTPRQPPKPAVTVSPSDESVDSRDGRPPVVDARYRRRRRRGSTRWTAIPTSCCRTAALSTADAADGVTAAAAGAGVDDAVVDDAASVDTSVCSERQTGWCLAEQPGRAECVGEGWEDARAERKKRPRGVRRRRRKTWRAGRGTSASTGK